MLWVFSTKIHPKSKVTEKYTNIKQQKSHSELLLHELY